jgi:hypothetical protein
VVWVGLFLFTWRCFASEGFRLPSVWARFLLLFNLFGVGFWPSVSKKKTKKDVEGRDSSPVGTLCGILVGIAPLHGTCKSFGYIVCIVSMLVDSRSKKDVECIKWRFKSIRGIFESIMTTVVGGSPLR